MDKQSKSVSNKSQVNELKKKFEDYASKKAELSKLTKEVNELEEKIKELYKASELEVFECERGKVEELDVEKSYVDVGKLKAACKDDKLFMRMVSATQKAVTEHVGDIVLQKCLVTSPAGKAVKITLKKK